MKDNGIDISATGRPGGVPTHVVSRPTAAPGTRSDLPGLVQAHTGKPATWNPFAGIVNLRKAIGRRLS